ncbi:hypothetical protein EV356DRAFT_575535 [Viridothelium virens]|uniref:Aminoglycoside phosphotransferase domain-containing protein n=1 Tax=Viridothelium virens TaxID=1048519 RepID=A0A6A6HCX6_VIRVR|nr:hypothetical protein EV356DRAFT_575535 [Viridothelium virens]
MADKDLITEEGVSQFLLEGRYPSCSRVKRLPGGVGGFVYRAEPDPNSKIPSVIVKHVQPFAARLPSWKLDPARLEYEVKMLEFLSRSSMQDSDIVRPPKLLHYDEQHQVVITEDLGALPSLKGWFTPAINPTTSEAIGHALGRFLAKVHISTAGRQDLLSDFAGNADGRDLSATLYFKRLPSAAAKFGYADDYFKEVARVGEAEVRESQEVLTLGDFWTGNVLVSTTPALRLYPLDFEFAKAGTAAFDVGQMAAEMYCFAMFRDHEKGMVMLESFFRAYREVTGSEELVDAAKVAIRIGAHLLMIIPSAWSNEADDEQIREMVRKGASLIRIGWEGNSVELRESIVESLLE